MYTCHFAKTYLFQYGSLQDTNFYSWAASKKKKNCCPYYNLRTEKNGFNISFSLGFGQKVRWQTFTTLRGDGPLRTSRRLLGWETPWLGLARSSAQGGGRAARRAPSSTFLRHGTRPTCSHRRLPPPRRPMRARPTPRAVFPGA